MKTLNIKLPLIGKLALKDLLYDRKISICMMASLIAVIGPLLLLFSLKFGTVTHLQTELLNNPVNLSLFTKNNEKFTPDFVKWVEQQPETNVVIPNIRSITSQVQLRNKQDPKKYMLDVEMLTTKKNDPITKLDTELGENKVVISKSIANKMQLSVNDELEIIFQRKYNNQLQIIKYPVKVYSIIDSLLENKERIYISIDLAKKIDLFIDGGTVPLFHPDGDAKIVANKNFAKLQIYVNHLEDVESLVNKLETEYNLTTYNQLNAIKDIKNIDKTLTTIFNIIFLASIIGIGLSFFGSFLANVERKRKELALLQLLGFKNKNVIIFHMFQAIIIAMSAYLFSCMIYYMGSMLLNYLLISNMSTKDFISTLTFIHVILGLIFTVIFACLVVLLGIISSKKIETANLLRGI